MYSGVKNEVWKLKKAFEQEFLAQKCRSLEFTCLFGFFFNMGEKKGIYKVTYFSLFFVHSWDPDYCFDVLETDFIHSEYVQSSMQNSLS